MSGGFLARLAIRGGAGFGGATALRPDPWRGRDSVASGSGARASAGSASDVEGRAAVFRIAGATAATASPAPRVTMSSVPGRPLAAAVAAAVGLRHPAAWIGRAALGGDPPGPGQGRTALDGGTPGASRSGAMAGDGTADGAGTTGEIDDADGSAGERAARAADRSGSASIRSPAGPTPPGPDPSLRPQEPGSAGSLPLADDGDGLSRARLRALGPGALERSLAGASAGGSQPVVEPAAVEISIGRVEVRTAPVVRPPSAAMSAAASSGGRGPARGFAGYERWRAGIDRGRR